MYFEVVGKIRNTTAIAVGGDVRVRQRLRRVYGPGRWKKMKGTAEIRLENGEIRSAELHWYEAHGIGKKEIKIKRFVS